MGDEYRDDRGHFSTKEQDGGPCRHGFETAEKAKSSFDSAMREGLWRSGAKAVQEKVAREFPGATVSGSGRQMEMSVPLEEEDGLSAVVLGKEMDDLSAKLEYKRSQSGDFLSESYRVSEPGKLFESSEFKTYEEAKAYYDKAVEKAKGESGKAREYGKKMAEESEENRKIADRILHSDDPSVEEEIEKYDDDPLTSGTMVGGYVGKSRSASAEASEEMGSRPMSHWTRDRILKDIEEFDSDGQLAPFAEYMGKMPLTKLRKAVLYEDGWHHTGKFYNVTNFYAIRSPRDIVRRLRETASFKNGLEKGLWQ